MKNKNIWILLVGVVLGVALSANVPAVTDQFLNVQDMAVSGTGGY